jgi:hypothetical protein
MRITHRSWFEFPASQIFDAETTNRRKPWVYGLKNPMMQSLTPLGNKNTLHPSYQRMNMKSTIPFMKRLKISPRTAPRNRRLALLDHLNVSRKCVWFCGLLLLLQSAVAADFTVTSPGFFYAISGMQPNPTLTLERGKTYTFAVNAGPTHPFLINSPGVQNNNISQGTITYTVPNVASNYSYICSIHGFGAQILTVPPQPPPPPTIKLLSLTVSSNLVLLSTGTNGWSVNPQFSTNLGSTNWFALAVLTNRFLSGTNETICGRPPGDSVFIRIQSSPN